MGPTERRIASRPIFRVTGWGGATHVPATWMPDLRIAADRDAGLRVEI